MLAVGYCLLIVTLVEIPQLTPEQRFDLLTASDNAAHDHREKAFDALLENTAEWTRPFDDEDVRIEPDLDSLTAHPADYRGKLCRLSGRIELIEPLAAPHDGVHAWFVRDSNGRPALLYIDHRQDAGIESWNEGDYVEVFARFYKVIEKRARDNQIRRYAAFVGALPLGRSRPMPAVPSFGGTPMFITVAVLGGVFLVIWLVSRRAPLPKGRHKLGAGAVTPSESEGANLPDDPAEALAVLDRRKE